MLVKFDEVCCTHNLQYSLAFGSLLGCVRHNGFIPWDDDIDVVMPRADYEKLKDYKKEFEDPYFLQYPGENEGYFFSFAKLRNSNTTAISRPFRYEKFNQGMFLDIFPLDNYSSINIEENLKRIKSLIAESSALMRQSCPYPYEDDIRELSQIREGSQIIAELDSILRMNESLDTDKYIVWSISIYDYKKKIFEKCLFDDLVDFDFYGHRVKIPRNPQEVLQITYNDFMQYPPVEQRGSWHSMSIFNPDVPYKVSLEKIHQQERQ